MARRPLALLAALLATVLAGCSGSSDPLTSVMTAVDTSLSQTFISRLTLTGAEAFGAKPTQELRGGGVFDIRQRRGFAQVDLFWPPLNQNKPRLRDFLIFLPTKIFLTPMAQTEVLGRKKVISVPLTGTEATAGGATRFVAQAMGLNPVLLLDEIAAGGTAAVRTGSEVASHVPYTDYEVTVDLRRALRGVHGPFARAERVAIRQQLAALGPRRSDVKIVVRLDGAGFVRGLKTTLPGTKLGKLVVVLGGYGSELGLSRELTHPADAHVVSLASLAQAWAWSPHWPWMLGG